MRNSAGSSQHATRSKRLGDDGDVARLRPTRGRLVGGRARAGRSAVADEEPALHHPAGVSSITVRTHSTRRLGGEEAVEGRVDHGADGRVGPAHDRLEVADGAEEVAAVDGRRRRRGR